MRLIGRARTTRRAPVMEPTGSCLTNKYSGGYAKKRYYEGQQVIDQVEELAIRAAQEAVRRDRAAGGEDTSRQRAAVLREPREPRLSISHSVSRATS